MSEVVNVANIGSSAGYLGHSWSSDETMEREGNIATPSSRQEDARAAC